MRLVLEAGYSGHLDLMCAEDLIVQTVLEQFEQLELMRAMEGLTLKGWSTEQGMPALRELKFTE